MITFPLLFHYFSKKSRFEIVSVKNPFLRVSLKPTDHYGPLQNLRTTTKPTDLTLKPTDLTKIVLYTTTDHYDLTLKPTDLTKLVPHTTSDHYGPDPKTYGPHQTCPTHHYGPLRTITNLTQRPYQHQ